MIIDDEFGLKIGSEEEKFWNDLKKRQIEEIKNAQRSIVISTEIINLCEDMLFSEQQNLNTDNSKK